jgi:predicted dehydrogenase
MKATSHISRRAFLKAVSILVVAAPFILPSHVWGAETAPSDPLTLGFIGLGKQGRELLDDFLRQDTRVLAICDVDATRRDFVKQAVDTFYTNNAGTAYNDFRDLIARKDIDAVCIATPEHWHAIPTLAALHSGKDVYCEKPLTHNIHEADAVLKAVPAHKRVLQTGSMQRSMNEFRVACELVRNGVIGKIQRVECSFGDPGRPCDLPEETPEPGLDWDRWCGPAPLHSYNAVLSPCGSAYKYYPAWRDYREFGSGGVCDWGAHHLDIAQWGLGTDDSGPVEVIPPDDPNAKLGAKLVYAGGITVEHKAKGGFGVDFFGSGGEVRVNRGKFLLIVGSETVADYSLDPPKAVEPVLDVKTTRAKEVAKAEKLYLSAPPVKLYRSKQHISDFLSCVKSRQKPICNEQVGARSAICCHLINQCYYHHAHLKWDPAKFKFTGGSGDPKWLTRDYRKPLSV